MNTSEHSEASIQVDGEPARAAALYVCPYCGSPTPDQPRCVACRGFLDPLSRQASQNAMGPWSVRNPEAPFQTGCSYETMVMLIGRGRVSVESVVRGPTTHQFWTPAKRVPGLAHLLGVCHNCGSDVDGDEPECPDCHAEFTHHADRQSLGLMPVRAVPGQPVPAAAEAPRHSPREEPPAIAEPSGALLRHITALEGQVRWVWRLVVLLLAIVGVLVALGLAAVFSGIVRLDPAWAPASSGEPEARTGNAAGPAAAAGGGVRRADGAVDPASPAAPEPPAAPNGGNSPDASPQAEPGVPAAAPEEPAEPVNPSRRAAAPTPPGQTGALAEARTLIARDTEDSLNEAVRKLEGVAGEEAESLRKAARGRLAQKAMKGVR